MAQFVEKAMLLPAIIHTLYMHTVQEAIRDVSDQKMERKNI